MYSASQVESATVGCFLLFHETKELFLLRLIQYPVVLRITVDTFTVVPLRYLKTCLTVTHCSSVGSAKYCGSLLTTKLKSGLVHMVRYIRLPTAILYILTSSICTAFSVVKVLITGCFSGFTALHVKPLQYLVYCCILFQ